MRTALLTSLAALAMGCGGSTTVSLSGPPGASRPPSCDFIIYAGQVPPGQFIEIGVIDVNTRWGAYPAIPDFKQEIAPHVCKAGGHAVLAISNNYGQWIKGAILRRVTATAIATTETAPAASPQQGCQFDKQCKGDRVCNAGQCMSPVPAAPAPAPTVDASVPTQ